MFMLLIAAHLQLRCNAIAAINKKYFVGQCVLHFAI